MERVWACSSYTTGGVGTEIMAPHKLRNAQQTRNNSKSRFVPPADIKMKRKGHTISKPDAMGHTREGRSLTKAIRALLARSFGGRETNTAVEMEDRFAGHSYTRVSTPRDAASLDSLRMMARPSTRVVSFNKVVEEVLIETREQRYYDLATKQEAFYSHAELAVFKWTWYLHIRKSEWPSDGLMRCGCPSCDKGEEDTSTEIVVLPALAPDEVPIENYAKWIWEG